MWRLQSSIHSYSNLCLAMEESQHEAADILPPFSCEGLRLSSIKLHSAKLVTYNCGLCLCFAVHVCCQYDLCLDAGGYCFWRLPHKAVAVNVQYAAIFAGVFIQSDVGENGGGRPTRLKRECNPTLAPCIAGLCVTWSLMHKYAQTVKVPTHA